MRIFIAAAFIAATAFVPAEAGTRTVKLPPVTVRTVRIIMNSMPPKQYDMPYTGQLRLWDVASQERMREICPSSHWGDGGVNSALGCAKVFTSLNKCDIYIVNKDVMKQAKTAYSSVLRHELAHCNGWPADHANKTLVPADRETKVKLPPETQTLRAYPPLVCLTPDGQEESCAARSAPTVKVFTTRDPWNFR
jgi:hypothetical protein